MIIQRKPKEIWILRRAEGLERVFAKLQGQGPLANDTETSGLIWHRDRVGAINLAANGVAIMAIEDALGPTARFIADQIRVRREFVFHHAKFDLHMERETFGLHFPYPVHDTRISSYLLDNRGAPIHTWPYFGGHSLKPLAAAHVDPDAPDIEQKLLAAIRRRNGKRGRAAAADKADWAILLNTEDENILFEYGPMDAWYTLQLHEYFMERINGWIQPAEEYPPLKELYETEQWVLLALRDMEERGIFARRQFLEQWRDALVIEGEAAYHHLWKTAGKKEINWNSTPQVRQLLFGSRQAGGLGIESIRQSHKTKLPSADKIALVLMAHPIGQALLAYRKIQKEISDANGILDHIRKDTHAIHADFNQIVNTGRMSCRDPNMQNRKRESEMRKAFRARKGLYMRSADYSQVELRIAACRAKERVLLEAFRTGQDPHTATSQNMFGLTKVTEEQRVHGKTLNFAGVYGAGAPGIAEQLMAKMSAEEARHACRKLHYTPSYGESPWIALAQLLSDRHRRLMPSIQRASKRAEYSAKKWGMVMNQFGRHRYLLPNEDAHIAFNTDVQGSAADVIKRAMATLYRELQIGSRGEIAMLLQVHDELVYETAGDPRTDRRVKEIMEDHKTLEIPLIVDIKDVTKSWKDKRKIEGL